MDVVLIFSILYKYGNELSTIDTFLLQKGLHHTIQLYMYIIKFN